MTRASRIHGPRRLAALLLLGSAGIASAQSTESAAPVALPGNAPQDMAAPVPAPAPWRAPAGIELRVVELPQSPLVAPIVGVPQRAHHALSLRTPSVSRALGQIGFGASDCMTRFRLPTRLRPAVNGAGSTLDVQAQVGLSCSF